MFDDLAGRYDRFNSLVSMGRVRKWRDLVLAPLRPGMRVLDLGCGTGGLTFGAASRVGAGGEVVGLDFSPGMLRAAQGRLKLLMGPPAARVSWVLGRAEEFDGFGRPFDHVVSGFTLRNFGDRAPGVLEKAFSNLKRGGGVSLLDITEPSHPALAFLFWAYMLSFVAAAGFLFFGGKYPFWYLADSARRFCRPPEFKEMMARAGFVRVRSRVWMMGMMVLYEAEKPA